MCQTECILYILIIILNIKTPLVSCTNIFWDQTIRALEILLICIPRTLHPCSENYWALPVCFFCSTLIATIDLFATKNLTKRTVWLWERLLPKTTVWVLIAAIENFERNIFIKSMIWCVLEHDAYFPWVSHLNFIVICNKNFIFSNAYWYQVSLMQKFWISSTYKLRDHTAKLRAANVPNRVHSSLPLQTTAHDQWRRREQTCLTRILCCSACS